MGEVIDVDALNARFGRAGVVNFEPGPGGPGEVAVRNGQAEARIALQGAQVLSWAPKGQVEAIWLSPFAKYAPGKSVRGGVPICWPWFGPHPERGDFPAHGFARTVMWTVGASEVLEDGRTRLVFQLVPGGAQAEQWPHATPLECQVTVGETLEIELVTRNCSAELVTIGAALHTYFAVADVRHIAIHGLDGCPYIDKVDNGRTRVQKGPVTIGAEVDRIYLDSTSDCVIEDPGLKRRICVRKRGSRSSVVWNPWIEKANKMGDLGEDGYLRMVCVESTNAASDVVTIAPDSEHRLWVSYSLEPMA